MFIDQVDVLESQRLTGDKQLPLGFGNAVVLQTMLSTSDLSDVHKGVADPVSVVFQSRCLLTYPVSIVT